MSNMDLLADKLDFTYKKEESPNDFTNILATVMNYWYVFVISILICLAASFFYIMRLPSQWNVYGKIIVEDDKNSPSKALTNGVNADLASLFNISSNADNEVKVLKSRSLLRQVIVSLNLYTHIAERSGIREHEIFSEVPFSVRVQDPELISKSHNYEVTLLNDNQYRLKDTKGKLDVTAAFGTPVDIKQTFITINKTRFTEPGNTYKLGIQSLKQAEKDLAAKFNAGLDDKQATVIDLQLSYDDPEEGEAVMQKFMQLYLKNNLANKVRIADSTMKFINNRLVVVGAELNNAENKLEQYKVSNKISDITAQSKALIEGADNYQNKLNENEVQLAIVNDLYKYVNDGTNPQVVPSSLITKDMSFGTAINAYNEMLLRKEQLKLTVVETSDIVKNLDAQIDLARKALLLSLKNYQHSLLVSQDAFKKQNSTITGKIASAPVKERIYLDYSRQQGLKQDLYLFLLQKREETAISQTATISNCRILDNAESDIDPYFPKKSIIYMIGLLIGICIPAAGLGVKEILNTRIATKQDVDRHSDVPLLAEISRNGNKKKQLIYNDSRSVISEEIRALRTSLKYVTEGGKSNVILFTSSMSGEGKSFLSINLGNSIALSGKKVVLLELDLRKPKLLKNIGVESDYGFTNYVISPEKEGLSKLIRVSSFNKNFHYISSGSIPPNPAELLMSERLKTLIEELKSTYDYVIIDSAPVGLVSDALIIEEYADITCYVIRQNYTYKSQLGIVNDLYKSKKVKQLYLVVNDIEVKKNGMTGYGYGYGNYEHDLLQNNATRMSSLFKKLKAGKTIKETV